MAGPLNIPWVLIAIAIFAALYVVSYVVGAIGDAFDDLRRDRRQRKAARGTAKQSHQRKATRSTTKQHHQGSSTMNYDLHVLCRDKLYLDDSQFPICTSSYWNLTEDEAKRLVGGRLFLHKTKREPSYIGGRVTAYRFATKEDHPKYAGRAMLTFEVLPEGRDAEWKGDDSQRASQSGLVPSGGAA